MGIRVNAIAPGPIETPMMGSALTEYLKEAYAKTVPVGRIGRYQDIGDAASFITEVTQPVAGGTDLKVSPS